MQGVTRFQRLRAVGHLQNEKLMLESGQLALASQTGRTPGCLSWNSIAVGNGDIFAGARSADAALGRIDYRAARHAGNEGEKFQSAGERRCGKLQ